MIDIYIASDHAGFKLKSILINYFSESFQIYDLGPQVMQSIDYPDQANLVSNAMKVNKPKIERMLKILGILVCKSGIGMSIAANRHHWIRAALCFDVESTSAARKHNAANVLVLGSSCTESALAKQMVYNFIYTPFDQGRHLIRVEKLSNKIEIE